MFDRSSWGCRGPSPPQLWRRSSPWEPITPCCSSQAAVAGPAVQVPTPLPCSTSDRSIIIDGPFRAEQGRGNPGAGVTRSITAVGSRADRSNSSVSCFTSRETSSATATATAMAAAAAVDAGVYEEMLRVVEACAARIRWRLRPLSKRRLLNDILFLCTGLRSVVLMDYGGTMPQLQENLCSLLHHARQESTTLKPLKVMVIRDMLYLIHVNGLAEYASPNARSQHQLAFVDLEKSFCKLLSNPEENDNVMEFVSIQDLFSAKFPVDTSVNLPVSRPAIPKKKSEFSGRPTNVECINTHVSEGTLLVDLSAYLDTTQVALPSLNGWLLGYPVTYLFCNGSAEAAIQNLSKHSLHIYRVYVRRSCQSGPKQSEEELMCFSVPCEMSTERGEEPWVKSFVAQMNEKIRQCNEVWASMRLEIEVFQSQSQVIVL